MLFSILLHQALPVPATACVHLALTTQDPCTSQLCLPAPLYGLGYPYPFLKAWLTPSRTDPGGLLMHSYHSTSQVASIAGKERVSNQGGGCWRQTIWVQS